MAGFLHIMYYVLVSFQRWFHLDRKVFCYIQWFIVPGFTNNSCAPMNYLYNILYLRRRRREWTRPWGQLGTRLPWTVFILLWAKILHLLVCPTLESLNPLTHGRFYRSITIHQTIPLYTQCLPLNFVEKGLKSLNQNLHFEYFPCSLFWFFFT